MAVITNGRTARPLSETADSARAEAAPAQLAAIQPIALRIPDAAAAAGLSRTTLYELMDQGQLAYLKVGVRRLILRDDLVAFLIKHRTISA